ncbi:PID-CTERM protein-sorting domain-containing protein [Fodinibius halophilus]|uniref:PEP-CTERM sorting domain-containing protein n=1 Tax=Fodinibius halophilus TaxID=1736908 RepID=A0A6M1T2A7_9BACT|nr:hypothetical protein [Fodinibius halophilus]NGP90208.1 hypothetical protein [Fodinibius halophilus]
MKSTILIVFFIVILLFAGSALAQPGLPGDPPQTPIDGGIIWMLLAGGAYGYKKLRGTNIKEEN